MAPTTHVFHTKHDFTPALGWAAFQLLASAGQQGMTRQELSTVARLAGSPLTRRSEPTKILTALDDLGLLQRHGECVHLSAAGQALAQGLGSYETGFRAAVHCLYCWKWLWDGQSHLASPSWSYRQVCHQLLASPTTGVLIDDLVLQVVAVAEQFGAMKVSFSRSSITGVTAWLAAQVPPLAVQHSRRVSRLPARVPSATTLRLHLAALCALGDGQILLNKEHLQLLTEGLLIPTDEWWLLDFEMAQASTEFLIISNDRKRVVFRGSTDPFLEWIVHQSRKHLRRPQHTNNESVGDQSA
jgi:hypothetical protein